MGLLIGDMRRITVPQPSDWKISNTDRPILEGAIGAATIDRLRGLNTGLVNSYKAMGGQDQTTAEVLQSYEQTLSSADFAKAATTVVPDGSFRSKYQEWDMSTPEFAKVARAVGASILAKVQGGLGGAGGGPAKVQGGLGGAGGGPAKNYEQLGGKQPQAKDALQKANGLLAKKSR